MRRALGWAGLHGSASSTPDEFLEQTGDALSGKQQLTSAVQDVTYLYQQAAFGRVPPDAHQIEQVRKAWRHTLGERISLYLHHLLLAVRKIFW